MKEALLSALLGVVLHYANQYLDGQGQAVDPLANSGALTMHYAEAPDFKTAADAFIGHALAFIQRGDALQVTEPVTLPTPEAPPEPTQTAPVDDSQEVASVPDAPVEVLPSEV